MNIEYRAFTPLVLSNSRGFCKELSISQKHMAQKINDKTGRKDMRKQ